MNYALHLIIYLEVFAILALSLNLVVGYCGLLTLAHASFFALGGYIYAILTVAYGWTFLQAVPVAAMITGLASLLISIPAWRTKGDFFIIISLAVQALVFSLLANWSDASSPLGSWANMTNGQFGIPGVAKPEILGARLDSLPAFAALGGVIALMIAAALARLQASPWGRVLVAMREDELAARSLGKNTRLFKTQAFAISAGAAAIAGCVYASYIGYLDPAAASLNQSILLLSMVVVGGVGNLRGPLLGAAIIVLLPELLKSLDLPDAQAATARVALYGALLVVFMHLRPQGILGTHRYT